MALRVGGVLGRERREGLRAGLLPLGGEVMLPLAHCRDSAQSHQESLSVLRASSDFERYAVSVAVQKLLQLKDTGYVSGPDGQSSERLFQNLCSITR